MKNKSYECTLELPVSLNFIQPAAIFLFNLSWSLGGGVVTDLSQLNSSYHVDCKVRCCCINDNETFKISIFYSYYLNWITRRFVQFVVRQLLAGCSKCITFCTFEI